MEDCVARQPCLCFDVVSGTEKLRLRRDLTPVMGKVQEKDVILLRDPLAMSSQVLAVAGGAVQVLQLLDGSRDMARLRLDAIALAGGDIRAGDDAQALLEILDERYLMDNARFRDAVRSILDDWRADPERPASFSGSGYPEDPGDLSRSLEDVLDHAPGITTDVPSGKLVALVAPHIDLREGWLVYGAAYGFMGLAVPEPERILVLGTGHSLERQVLCPTRKNYVTPLGMARTDVQAVDRIVEIGGLDRDDLAHRGEHSIEFQVIFLQHLFGDDLQPLVPVLCGDASRHLEDVSRPSELPGAAPVIEWLAPQVADGETFVVAGVDLCHVGPRFGDGKTASELLPAALEHETALIDALESVDPVAFWQEARRVGDRHHVCGLTALGILLELMPQDARGVLLCRDVMRDRETSSAVGYAAMAFFTP